MTPKPFRPGPSDVWTRQLHAYVPAASTNIRDTFERVRAAQERQKRRNERKAK